MVTTSSTNKYKKYNDAVATPEGGGSYAAKNHTMTEIINGKEVLVEKPVEQWALGRYQHYYKYHEKEIIAALNAQGIDTSNLSKKDIANTYINSPKAQEIVQADLSEVNFKAAEKQIKKFNLKAPVEEVAFLNHFLGNGGANRYLTYRQKYGEEKADQLMAYGNDPDDPDFEGIGGPKSAKKNALVSKHIIKFRNGNTSNTASTTTTNQPEVASTESQKSFDDIVSNYKGVQEGSLNGIDELQYNPMGWGADKGVKRKGQNWKNHDNHIHLTFTDPQVAIAVIKKAQEIGLNPNENLYVGEVHDVHKKHPVTGAKESLHYFNFDGEFDGKQLSKGLDINFKNTGLTEKEGHAKMKQLYKWIHQTYSI